MTDALSTGLSELLRKAQLEGNIDCLRDAVCVLTQALMEREGTEHLQAGRHERRGERPGYRNGYRERQWDTRVGTIDLRVQPGR